MRAPDAQLVAITGKDGHLVVMAFITAEYHANDTVRSARLATAEAVDAEIARAAFSFPDLVTRPPTEAERTAGAYDVADLPITGWRFIDASELPSERRYRNAWRDQGGAVAHDMVRARDIHRDRLRSARAPLLVELDVRYVRAQETALETGDTSSLREIAREKQRLRDVTAHPAIEAATSIDALADAWPLQSSQPLQLLASG